MRIGPLFQMGVAFDRSADPVIGGNLRFGLGKLRPQPADGFPGRLIVRVGRFFSGFDLGFLIREPICKLKPILGGRVIVG